MVHVAAKTRKQALATIHVAAATTTKREEGAPVAVHVVAAEKEIRGGGRTSLLKEQVRVLEGADKQI